MWLISYCSYSLSLPSTMPIHSLPLEIVHEIASHLRAPSESDTQGAVEAGQSLSLVCRGWYPSGQALRWRAIQSDVVFVPSLLAHFDLFPHLAHLVTSLKQSSLKSEDPLIVKDERGFDSVPRLLGVLQNLRSFHLRIIDSAFEPVLRAAASRSNLVSVNIYGKGALTWSKTIAAIFARGFPSIREFLLISQAGLSFPAEGPSGPTDTKLKTLQHLSLTWSGYQITSPIQPVLANVNFASLRTLFLGGVPACTFPFEWLAYCTSLECLRVYDSPHFLASTLPTLLANLSKASSLQVLEYQLLEDIAGNTSYLSPVTLDEVFASVPSSLGVIQVTQLLFPHSDSFQDQSPSIIGLTGAICLLQGLMKTSEGNRCMLAWKANTAKESKCCRCIVNRASWKDINLCTSLSSPSRDAEKPTGSLLQKRRIRLINRLNPLSSLPRVSRRTYINFDPSLHRLSSIP